VTAPIERARALLSRAVHVSTPTEEARTSAWAFARIVHEHGLLDRVPDADGCCDCDDGREQMERVPIVSRFRGRCKECRRTYEIGDEIWWARGSGAICACCAEERAA
jgi:hypothetical protein